MKDESFILETSIIEIEHEMEQPKNTNKRKKTMETNKKKKEEADWISENFQGLSIQPFIKNEVVTLEVESEEPVSYFKYFLNKTVVGYIATLTNKKNILKGRETKPITTEELYTYFGFLLAWVLKG